MFYLIYECPVCGYKNKIKELKQNKFILDLKHSPLKGFVLKKFKCENCFKISKLYFEEK